MPPGAAVAGPAELSGRVTDEQAKPVAAALVHVLGREDPFGSDHSESRVGWNDLRGRTIESDGQGRWRAVMPAPARVTVVLGESAHYRRLPGANPEREVDAPASDVDFVVTRRPTAVLEIRAARDPSREPIEDFSCLVRGDPDSRPKPGEPARYTKGYWQKRSQGAVVRLELPVESPTGLELLVQLTEPRVDPPPEQVVRLVAGELEEVLFLVPRGEIVRGSVVDESGAPIAAALVYFGDARTGRGDEPFRAFRQEGVRGERTAADGRFELAGEGATLGVWHPEFTGAIVPVGQAGRIVLGPRGSIRGRLLDEHGRPLSAVEILLDDNRRGPSARTDEAGRFAFESLEAGAHALWGAGGELLAGVRLAAGEQAELQLVQPAPAARIRIELRSDHTGSPIEDLRGVLVGLERVFGCEAIRPARPGPLPPAQKDGVMPSQVVSVQSIRGGLLPGRYLLVTVQGIVSRADVGRDAEVVVIAIGSAELVVRTRPGRRLQLVPEDADPFVRLMAARVSVRTGDDGIARFRVHPGRHLLVDGNGVELQVLEIPARGAELTIE